MASKLIFTTVVVLLMLLCCSSAYECFGADAAGLREIPHRKLKMLSLKDKKATLKASLRGSSQSIKYGEKPLSWELRKVPSGPDPLHHNGVNPKKPQTP
ncbi:protein CLAVATA 3 [Cajanus cajan]|uniref:protein CLAVATA 3 n=1 Tax=Cajanus cajan TaxID=3821 RepID=UPI00098DA6DF|nr:protein CLAVATA 3 [Cajanus cajan]